MSYQVQSAGDGDGNSVHRQPHRDKKGCQHFLCILSSACLLRNDNGNIINQPRHPHVRRQRDEYIAFENR